MRTDPGRQSHPRTRRQILAGCLGLVAGMARRAGGRPDRDRRVSTRSPTLGDGERLLSLDPLGVPRSSSVIRRRSHPFAPERIAVLPSGDSLRCEENWGPDLRRRIDGRIGAIRDLEGYDLSPSSDEKKGAIFAIVDLMTGHYRVPQVYEGWVVELAFLETLIPKESADHLGILPRFQNRCDVAVDSPPVDWWLFVFPDGVDWGSPDGKRVHVLLGHVSRLPTGCDPRRFRTSLGWLTRRLREHGVDWRQVACLGRVEAARYLNPLFADLLDLFSY